MVGGRKERRLRKGGGGERLTKTNWFPWIALGQPRRTVTSGQGSTQSLALQGLAPRRHFRERLEKDVGRRGRNKVYFLSFYSVLGPMPGNSQTVSCLIIITIL